MYCAPIVQPLRRKTNPPLMSSTDAWPINVAPDLEEKHEKASIVTRTDFKDPGPPPDGGLNAWLQVLSAHLVLFNTWGYINSFGIFQSYYTSTLQRPPDDIAWIGSIETFFVYFVGMFSGRATDAGYYRIILVAGLFLQLLGVFMTSLSTTYWQLFLAQGLCQGLGDGLLFCPTVALVSTYFAKKRVFALSLMASGAATGGLVFPAIAQSLLYKIGFAWTVRIMGFVMFFNAVVCIIIARPRLPPRRTGPFIEWAAFKEAPYVFFTLGTFLTLWGVYFAFYYVSSIALVTVYSLTTLGPTFCTQRAQHIILHIILLPSYSQRCWCSRTNCPGDPLRPIHRSSQRFHTYSISRRGDAIRVDRRGQPRRYVRIRCHLRLVRRGGAIALSSGTWIADARSEQSRCQDWDGVFGCQLGCLERSAHRR